MTKFTHRIQKWWVWRHWYRKQFHPRLRSLEERAARQLAILYVNWVERSCSTLFFPTAPAHRQYENHLINRVLSTAHTYKYANIASIAIARVEHHTKQEFWHRSAYDLYHFLFLSLKCSNGWTDEDRHDGGWTYRGRGPYPLEDPILHPWTKELVSRLEEDRYWTTGPELDYRTWDFPLAYRRHSI